MRRRPNSLRCPHHDYGSPASYLITIVTWHREPLLARVEAGTLEYTQLGTLVLEEWARTLELRRELRSHAFVVMPDHVHAVVDVIPTSVSPSTALLGNAVRGFKAAVKRRAVADLGNHAPIWQRNYHDQLLTTTEYLMNAIRYVHDNPRRFLMEGFAAANR